MGAPAKDEAAFRGGAGEGAEDDLSRKIFCLGGAHEGGADAGADEAHAVRAGPDFFGDARGDARGGKGGEDTIVETGVMRAGKKHERRRREIPKVKLTAAGEGVIGGEEDAVFFLKQEVSAEAGGGRIGVEETAGEVAGLQSGELGGGGGFVKLEFDAGVSAVELAENRG
jgi:hypothetical protein